jgi:hypothetical protein
MCVLFIVSAASARPPAKRPNRFDQVARPDSSHVRVKRVRKMRVERHRATHRRARTPRMLKAPRRYGDLVDRPSARRAYENRPRASTGKALSKVKQILSSRIKPRVRCADGVECGSSHRGKARKPSIAAKNRSFLNNRSKAQERYLQKRMKVIYLSREPAMSKALKSGCNDQASCL